ncbi:Protein CBG18533 [Caenorhabditis briggsae]|nr:Protein CBG18533 [Caenorhabditis briggsae]CAP35963.1 Protein CBG18533 [Caenorhabditis briggsae]
MSSPPQNRKIIREDAELEVEQSRELEIKIRELELLEKEKAAELFEERERQEKELEVLAARLEAEHQAKVESLAIQRSQELQFEKNRLERKKEERDALLALLLKQQKAFSEMLRTQESLRQKDLSQLREDRSNEKKNNQAEILELNKRFHETHMTGDERKDKVFEQNIKEQEKQAFRKGKMMWNELLHTNELAASLHADEKFEEFQEGCTLLRDQYRAFNNEYDNIEPQLIRTNNCMKKATPIKPFDLEKCISALRNFRNQTVEISVSGSEDESYYQGLISQASELVREIFKDINIIKATTEGYDHEECSDNVNIDENLTRIFENRQELSILMQKFNVIGKNHLQEALAIQMEKKMTARQEAAEKEEKDQSPPEQESE